MKRALLILGIVLLILGLQMESPAQEEVRLPSFVYYTIFLGFYCFWIFRKLPVPEKQTMFSCIS